MATISSHVLNAVHGTHAADVLVEGRRLGDDGSAETVFVTRSGADGRIAVDVPVAANDPGRVYEIVFHVGDYFERVGPAEARRIMPTVVLRLTMPDPDARYHMPVVASPHGYSVWWSE